METPPPRRTARLPGLFLSPADRRLRAGWRVLIHGLLSGSLLLAFVLPVGIAAAVAGLAVPGLELEPLIYLGGSLAGVAAVTLATWFARRFLDRKTWASLGFRRDRQALPDLLVGFAIPGLLMGLIFCVEAASGILRVESWAWETNGWGPTLLGLMGGLALFVAVGYEEELLSRGYQLQNLVEGTNLRLGLLLSALAFSALHLPNPGAGPGSILGILAAAYFLAFGWVRTRQLWLSIGLHIGWNFFEGTVFGFPVSGLEVFHLCRHTVGGPAWLTGGEFGPEAGLIVLPALALGAGLVWLYTRHRGDGEPLAG